MSLFAIFHRVIPWIATVKMLADNVETLRKNNTTSWLSYASWTWEILRRNPDYISYYNSLKNKGIEVISTSNDVMLSKGIQNYPTANKFGLLAPADPAKYAGEDAVFWCPKSFNNVVRFHLIDRSSIGRKNRPIQLSKMPGKKTHFLDANGTYHIRILGERFWFQLQCDDIEFVEANDYLGFELNHPENPDKKLKTMRQITGVYDGSIPLDSRLHVPAQLKNHQRSILAYDIRMAGGTISDVVSAFLETGLVVEDPDKFVDFNYVAQNAFKGGKAYIYGDYLKVLNRQ